MAGVKITVDAAAVAKLEQALMQSASAAMQAVHTDVVAAQVMPFDLGHMQNDQTFTETVKEGNEITARLVTGSPQARRLYYHPEYSFQTVNNSNAQGKWLKPWVDGEKADFARDAFAKDFKERAGT